MKTLITIWLLIAIHQFGYATEYIVTNLTELRAAHNASLPGDIITLRGGDYAVDGFTINRSGSATGGYITYRNYTGEKPKLIGQPTSYYTIVNILANYIQFTGVEIQGINQYCTKQEAEANYVASFDTTTDNWNAINKTSCNGICIGSVDAFQHHIGIKNCISHDNPGQGIGSFKSDYITIEGNTTYNNCFYGIWGASGINIHTSTDLDSTASDATSTKNYIIGNRSYNNIAMVPYRGATGASASNWIYTDGNGIIVDINQDTGYKGSTLVANNVSYNNGGAGINVTRSNNVSIHHNSTYCNGLWSSYAEFMCYGSQNLYIYNNIFYATGDGAVNQFNGTSSNVLFDFNIYYLGVINNYGANDQLNKNPQYESPATGNFKLTQGSPAINTATTISWITTDIDGGSRPIGSASDVGAYEYSGSGGRIGAEETSSAMHVVLVGNPIKENVVRVKVSGIGGQSIQLRLTDVQGRLVAEKRVEQVVEGEVHQLSVGKQRSGLLLLQVSTRSESRTLKVLMQ